MDFNAKGKGPLELPRLTSLGPASTTSNDIGDIVFRGSTLNMLNDDEFVDNNITGNEITLWYLDSPAVAQRYDIELDPHRLAEKASFIHTNPFNFAHNQGQYSEAQEAIIDEFRISEEEMNNFAVDVGRKEVEIDDLMDNGLIARRVEENVTGGISSKLGASISFAGGSSGVDESGLVMFLERNRIPTRLTKIEYTREFMVNNPTLAGAADKGSSMLVVPDVDEDYTIEDPNTFFDVGPWRKDRDDVDTPKGELVVNWFLNPLSSFYDLESEEEIMAHSKTINLDHSLFAVCNYVTMQKLNRNYKEITNDDDPESVKMKEKVRVLHNEIADRMKANSERLVTCVISTRVGAKKRYIPMDYFKTLYDGSEFTDVYRKAIPFTNPEKF